jgi:hypothetical protein
MPVRHDKAFCVCELWKVTLETWLLEDLRMPEIYGLCYAKEYNKSVNESHIMQTIRHFYRFRQLLPIYSIVSVSINLASNLTIHSWTLCPKSDSEIHVTVQRASSRIDCAAQSSWLYGRV